MKNALIIIWALSFPFRSLQAVDRLTNRFIKGPWLWQVAGSLLTVPFMVRNVRLPWSSMDRLLGNGAYRLYLFHWLPRDSYYRHVDWARGGGYNASLFAINVVAALAGSLAILFLIERPMDRMRSRWVTSRVRHPASERTNDSGS